MNRIQRGGARLSLLVAAAAVTACTEAPTAGAPPAMTYESLEALPDFSGWWFWQLDPMSGLPPSPFLGAELKPEAAAVLQVLAEQFAAGALPDLGEGRGSYCRPPSFVGFNGGFSDAVELLFTPGRVTILNESGLIRRVYLDEAAPRATEEATSTGTSVGRWEGNTLVIETTGLKSDNPFLPQFDIGNDARIVERIALKDADTLEIALHLSAPDVLAAPYETTLSYRRDPAHVFTEVSSCVDDDRSIDPDTGRQRFDMTPPPNLPPPPR